MRTTLVLLALAAAATLGVVMLLHDEKPSDRHGSVSLVGDSLNVGVEPYLRSELEGWRVESDDRVGRPTAEGLEVLQAHAASLAPWVVVSLGTNDPVGDVEEFGASVAKALALAGADRCVVWLTVHRDGEAYEPFNDVLRRQARDNDSLVLVDWAKLVRDDPTLLAADAVHGTETGYAKRASLVAKAVRSCSPAAADST